MNNQQRPAQGNNDRNDDKRPQQGGVDRSGARQGGSSQDNERKGGPGMGQKQQGEGVGDRRQQNAQDDQDATRNRGADFDPQEDDDGEKEDRRAGQPTEREGSGRGTRDAE